MKIILIHGSYGNSNENWFPWLKSKLEKLNCEVIIHSFPTPENQSLTNWLNIFDGTELDKNTIVVGHSLGVAFLLSLLEKYNIKAAFFVSGFIGKLNNSTFDKINKTFIEKDFDWNKIKDHCNNFVVYHSDNDPYVPLNKGKELAEKLDVEVNVIKNAGHFNEKSGYIKFEKLLENIKKQIYPNICL